MKAEGKVAQCQSITGTVNYAKKLGTLPYRKLPFDPRKDYKQKSGWMGFFIL